MNTYYIAYTKKLENGKIVHDSTVDNHGITPEQTAQNFINHQAVLYPNSIVLKVEVYNALDNLLYAWYK